MVGLSQPRSLIMTKTCGLCGLKDANGRCIATHEVMPSDTQACVNYDSAPLICHN